MKGLINYILHLIKYLNHVHISDIPREGNSIADAFANIFVLWCESLYWNGTDPLPPKIEDIIKLEIIHAG